MIVTNINKKQLLVSVLIPLAVGGLTSLINYKGIMGFEDVNQPALTPPMIVFPIVWTILYTLMGISSYLVYKTEGKGNKKAALRVYGLQLAVNSLWTYFFFSAQSYSGAFVAILVLLILIIAMIVLFYQVNKTSAYLQIPYLIWTAFAAYLNYMVWMLNT